ncbi:MAG: trypsin-like serine protease [Proteobacteria bacterium]|nr:MAG: trypsin-like serine protease [Pseudomonadota bacterium]
MQKLSSLLLFTGLIVSSCSVVPESSQTQIIGGRKVSEGQWTTVVAISEKQGLPFGFPPLTPEQLEMFKSELLPKVKCTGTALTPLVIVTAAHCFWNRGALPDGPVSWAVHLGNGVEGGLFEGPAEEDLLEIESTMVHPKYVAGKELGYDIAYIILKKPLNLPQSSFDAAETKDLLAPGQSVTAVGFGARSNLSSDKAPTGTKFEGDFTIFDAALERDAKDEEGENKHTPWDPETEIVVKDLDRGSCRGDSGGPLFAKNAAGEYRLFGIVSRAYGQDTCASYSTIFGLLPKSICWVQENSKQDLGLPANYCDSSK